MIYDPILSEMRARFLYLSDTYTPFYICSYAMHLFNVQNQKRKIYWVAKKVPNMRIHILFISPSGFMKTTFLTAVRSVFEESGTRFTFEQGITEAGLIGTVRTTPQGSPVKTPGIAETYHSGIVMMDEFKALTQAMKATYNAQLESHLLTVLDSGDVNKKLAGGAIKYHTDMTLWAGVQPGNYDLNSGLGRRLTPIIFLPTNGDNKTMSGIRRHTRNMRPTEDDKELKAVVRFWEKAFEDIMEVDFTDDYLDYLDTLNLFQFEYQYFDYMALGYALAKHGPTERVVVDIDDELRALLKLMKQWRGAIYDGIDTCMLLKLLNSIAFEYEGLMKSSIDSLVQECKMVSWNRTQVMQKLKAMADENLVRIKGHEVYLCNK